MQAQEPFAPSSTILSHPRGDKPLLSHLNGDQLRSVPWEGRSAPWQHFEEPCACVLRDSPADNRPGLFRGHDLSHHRAGTSASLQQVEVQE